MKKRRPASRASGLSMLEVLIATILLAGVLAITMALLFTSSNASSVGEVQQSLEMMAREVIVQMESELRAASVTGSNLQFNQNPPATAPQSIGGAYTPPAFIGISVTAQTRLGYPQPVPPPAAPPAAGAYVSCSDFQFRTTDPSTDVSLAVFKSNPAWQYSRQIRYFWDPAPNSDNSPPGQGVLRKIVTTFSPTTGLQVGNPVCSVICANLQPLPTGAAMPNQGTLPVYIDGFQINYTSANPGQVGITLTLEKYDPRSRDNKTLVKQICTTVQLRN